jgi:tetratricopeptide (TPR) repeat protein
LLLALAFVASLAAGETRESPCATLTGSVPAGIPPATRAEFQRAHRRSAAAPSDSSAIGRLAMLLQSHEQYRSAADCYARARLLNPQEFRWPYLAGVVQTALGEHREAARSFREALTIHPEYLPAQLRLADTLMQTGDLEASRAEYQTILQKDPHLALAHYSMGRVASLLGDLDDAIEHYRRAIQAAPQFGAAHYGLALALRTSGRASQANAHFSAYRQWGARRPVPHDPLMDDVKALNGTAREILVEAARLDTAGRLDEAIELHLKALAVDPAAAQAHVNLISLYGRTGRLDLAETHYQHALTLGTSLADAHYNYGVLRASAGRFTEAADAFQHALDVNPFHPAAHSNLGALLAREGKLERAASHYREAVSNNPTHAGARVNLARLLVLLNRSEEARTQFEQALRSATRLAQPDLSASIQRELEKLKATAR